MIALWHCVDARSFRPLWALEEIGVPYHLEILPFPPRFHAREYLKINPLGTIPLLVDGETRMTESAAICQYLAERYAGPPLAVRPDEQGYGAYLNALHFGEATLTFRSFCATAGSSNRSGVCLRRSRTTRAGHSDGWPVSKH